MVHNHSPNWSSSLQIVLASGNGLNQMAGPTSKNLVSGVNQLNNGFGTFNTGLMACCRSGSIRKWSQSNGESNPSVGLRSWSRLTKRYGTLNDSLGNCLTNGVRQLNSGLSNFSNGLVTYTNGVAIIRGRSN